MLDQKAKLKFPKVNLLEPFPSSWTNRPRRFCRSDPLTQWKCRLEKNPINKKKRALTKRHGFTLIEIIAVLVILGILASVAIPKYMDMQTTAILASYDAALGAAKSHVNMGYAKAMIDTAGMVAVADMEALIGTNDEVLGDYTFDFTITAPADKKIKVKIDTKGGPNWDHLTAAQKVNYLNVKMEFK